MCVLLLSSCRLYDQVYFFIASRRLTKSIMDSVCVCVDMQGKKLEHLIFTARVSREITLFEVLEVNFIFRLNRTRNRLILIVFTVLCPNSFPCVVIAIYLKSFSGRPLNFNLSSENILKENTTLRGFRRFDL